MLSEALRGILAPEEMAGLVSAFDQVGGIIIVRIPGPLMHRRAEIGRALLGGVKAARTVYCQSSPVGGDHRTRGLEAIAGPDDPRTEYRESGCRLLVDVREAFFSPRLSTERARIAGLVRDGEVVVNMFAGTGAFSIVAARRARCTVYSVDVNVEAVRLCERSLALNRLAGTVVPVHADASEAVRGGLVPEGDRTLMLLPERSDEFLGDAVAATRDGGTIHYYSHVHADRKADAAGLAERRYLGAAPARSEILGSRLVRAVGPRYYQAVVDARISK